MGKTAKKIIITAVMKPLVIIGAVWLFFCSPYFLKGLVPFPSKYLVTFFPPWSNYYGMPVKNNAMPDVITQIYPWKKITIDSWKRGQIPRWNPYQFAGTTHLANFQSAVFSPFNLLFFILPFNDAWSLLILLQPLLAGICMYLYLRSIDRGMSAALMGSLSFMFCSFIVTWMAYGTLAYAILFLPLLLYGIERYITKHDWQGCAIIIISIPLSIFSGHFQTSIYFLIAGSTYAIYRIITSKMVKCAPIIAGCMIIGLAISLPQLIPTYHLYQQSLRSNLFTKGDVISWQYIITAFAPDFFGNPVTRNDWFGHYAEWGLFSGAIPFILAFFAVFSKQKQKTIWYFRLLLIFAFLLAFPTPFGDLLISLKIPVLSTSALSRIVVLISFAISVLASFGLDAVIVNWNHQTTKKTAHRWIIICGSVLFIIWLFVFLHNLFFIPNVAAGQVRIARSNLVLPSLILFTAFGIWILGYQEQLKKRRNILVAILLFLTAVDVYRFASKWMPFDPKEYMYPQIKVLTYLQEHAGYSRVFGNFGNEAQSFIGLYGIEGYDPLYINRYGELMMSSDNGQLAKLERSVVRFPKNGTYNKAMLDLLGVKYFLHSKGDQHNVWVFPFWQHVDSFGLPVFSDEKYEIYQNNAVYPRAFLVYGHKVIKTDQAIVDYMFNEDTDLLKTVVVEKELASPLGNCEDGEKTGKADITLYTPNKIIIKTASACAGLLFLSDAYYPGWSATVNGQKAEILRVDYAFRAVVIPKGNSEVLFTYENWNF